MIWRGSLLPPDVINISTVGWLRVGSGRNRYRLSQYGIVQGWRGVELVVGHGCHAIIHSMDAILFGAKHALLTPDDPRQVTGRKGPPRRYPFAEMQVGDYIVLPDQKAAASCSTSAANFCRSHLGVRFSVRKAPTEANPEQRFCLRMS